MKRDFSRHLNIIMCFLHILQVSSEWVSREFTLVPYTGISGRLTHLLGGVDDLLASLEDSLTTLNTIKNSKYVSPIKVHVCIYSSSELVIKRTEQCVAIILYLDMPLNV